MRRIVRTLVALGLTAAAGLEAQAQPSSRPPAKGAPRAASAAPKPAAGAAAPRPAGAAIALKKPAPDPRRLDEVLRLWEQQSKDTKSLFARFTRDDLQNAWGTVTHYEGSAYLKAPNLAYLNFDKVEEGAKPAFSERIVCTNDRVYQFLAETREVHVFQMSQQDGKRAMEEGPLPFLFSMKADEAKARYAMTLMEENDTQLLIAIVPKADVDRGAFSRAYVWLDKAKSVPIKIQLVDPGNNKDTKTFRFTDAAGASTVRRNAPIDAKFFDGMEQSRGVAHNGWEIITYGPDGRPLPRAGRAGSRPQVGMGTVRAPQPSGRAAPAPRR